MKTNYIVMIILLFILAAVGYGDEYHNAKPYIGERPSGLGGAYTALSEDPAGLFFNPAGIAFAEDGASAGLNAYVRANTYYDKVLGDKGWNRTSGELVPGFLGGVYSMPKGTAGFSLVAADSEMVDQNEMYDAMEWKGIKWFDIGNINYNYDYKEYNIGPSYASHVTENLSFGMTLYIHYKTREVIINQLFRYLGVWEETDLTTLNIEESEWGLRPIIGGLWKIKPIHTSLGLTISRTFVLNRNYYYRYVKFYHEQDSEYPEDSHFEFMEITEISDSRREYPTIFSFGAAYQGFPYLTLTGDATWYSATKRRDSNITPSTFPTRSFINAAFGIEYNLINKWVFRLGVFTDLANNETSTIQPDESREVIDMYGLSFSISHKRDQTKFITIGCIYNRGSGEAALGDFGFGLHQREDATVPAKKSILRLYLSMSM